MNRFHDLHRRIAGLWNFVRRDAPDPCRVGAGLGIVDGALTGKLIALLAVLAPPLSVTLTRDHGATRPFTADISGSQAEIDQRQTVFDTFGLVLDAASMKNDGSLRFGKKVGGALDGFRRNAGLARNCSRIPGVHRLRDLFKASGIPSNETLVFEPVPQHNVKDSHVKRQVRSRPHGKIQVRVA